MSHRKTALFVHGSFDSGGVNSIDRLAPFFRDAGYTIKKNSDYGWTGPVSALLFGGRIAQIMADLIPAGTVGVGHSNGCNVLREAARRGARFSQLVFINPALDRRAEIAEQVARIHVWHSPSELPTLVARFLPFHPWGDMGRVGYKGADRRFVNYNKERDFSVISSGHSDVFEDDKLAFYGPLIVQKVEGFRNGA